MDWTTIISALLAIVIDEYKAQWEFKYSAEIPDNFEK